MRTICGLVLGLLGSSWTVFTLVVLVSSGLNWLAFIVPTFGILLIVLGVMLILPPREKVRRPPQSRFEVIPNLGVSPGTVPRVVEAPELRPDRYCSKCGAGLFISDNFCSHCGDRVNNS